MAKTASLRHIFVIQLFTLAAVVVVRPPSEARGAEAWDRAQTALRQVRMYDTMLSGYNTLSTTYHALELLPCASVDGRDNHALECASGGVQNGIICRRWSMP